MADVINAQQIAKRIDSDLGAIIKALADAVENEGKALCILDGHLAYEDGNSFFDITPLT